MSEEVDDYPAAEFSLPDAGWISDALPDCGECDAPITNVAGRTIISWTADPGGEPDADGAEVDHEISWVECENEHLTYVN